VLLGKRRGEEVAVLFGIAKDEYDIIPERRAG